MAANLRDHAAVRAERDGIVNTIGQLQCPGCGAWFLLGATLERHREAEIPGIKAWAAAANRAWEEGRNRPVIVSRDEMHAAQMRVVV